MQTSSSYPKHTSTYTYRIQEKGEGKKLVTNCIIGINYGISIKIKTRKPEDALQKQQAAMTN